MIIDRRSDSEFEKMSTTGFDNGIWPQIKEVDAVNFVSGIQSETLNPVVAAVLKA